MGMERENGREAYDDEGDVGDAEGGGDEVALMIGWERQCVCVNVAVATGSDI